jgi:hypothetical protein
MNLDRVSAFLPLLLAVLSCERGSSPGARNGARTVVDAAGAAVTDSAAARAFLDYLKSGQDISARAQGFDVERGGHWDVDRLLSFISDKGLILSDVNMDSTWAIDANALRRDVISRQGPSFQQLVHLAHIYAQPFPQYSALTFQQAGDSTVVLVADWYRVTLVRERGAPKVRSVAYLMHEGE